jgi:hypothetical protein
MTAYRTIEVDGIEACYRELSGAVGKDLVSTCTHVVIAAQRGRHARGK